MPCQQTVDFFSQVATSMRERGIHNSFALFFGGIEPEIAYDLEMYLQSRDDLGGAYNFFYNKLSQTIQIYMALDQLKAAHWVAYNASVTEAAPAKNVPDDNSEAKDAEKVDTKSIFQRIRDANEK
ncbi:hypothetical protein TWF718_002229 [Orbilia javanica]|uniref:Uncharacterized protein n=1 Tax=Orbilia javanica TaxID=47235 RepID=A0AAN8RJK5_9PEZI